jgi:dTDP-glucose pyrophosphorylase
MAAGMGSRYGGLKQIDPIGPCGEFIVDYSVYDAAKAGFDKVVFVIKKENEEIFRQTVGSRIKGIKVEYAFQGLNDLPEGFSCPDTRVKPWGTGHAVLCAESVSEGGFAVINADDFYGRESFELLAKHLKGAKAGNYCMVGYRVENTVTENGTVSRGVCEVENGKLTDVVERSKIQKSENGIEYLDEETNKWISLANDTPVSMNCWAFTPDFFAELKAAFVEFLKENINTEKKELFLPFVVQAMMKRGDCTVDVVTTPSKWYGVTYKEDREGVVESIRKMTENGTYPENLWG